MLLKGLSACQGKTEDSENVAETELSQEESNDKDICIVIDPGHGGTDPGALSASSEYYEKDINLSIALKVRDLLEAEGYTVILTREGDEKVSLSRRVQIAAEMEADLFISIHQNALEGDTVTTGTAVYCSTSANALSQKLAESLESGLLAATGTKENAHDYDSDFYVVLHATMPACLIECGFLTTPQELDLLVSETYQSQLAEGIVTGIREFTSLYIEE